ncbi:sugar ABC transporter ATP-binding protein [Leucobacter sp. W1153]|uniref:sugar ABC transporter ATP-binding protein n=1 Tax=Leucobacter sp. W1153 TaxID=3439064 RepID=UPI003F2B6EB9
MTTSGDASEYAVKIDGLVKRFDANTALDEVSLTVAPRTVHALLGMNGSGKSTIVKILSGYHQADAGEVLVGDINGKPGRIAFVHQDLALIQDMTVVENFALGRKMAMKVCVIDWRTEREQAKKWLQLFSIDHLVDTELSQITKSEQTIVAIARALSQGDGDISLLVLDEPTSTLPAAETQQLLAVMRDVAAQGIGILFVTHRLAEVMSIADEISVLRNGHLVYSAAIADTSVNGIAAAMAGKELEAYESEAVQDVAEVADHHEADQEILLSATNLNADTVRDLDLHLYRGEVLGIIGLLGSGIEDLGDILTARAKPKTGEVVLNDRVLVPSEMNRVGYVPANRSVYGTLKGMTARENASITSIETYVTGGRIDKKREFSDMHLAFEEMTVYPNQPELTIESLSGGNQQKVLFARWLTTQAEAILAVEPTQGVDVHAKAQILGVLRERAKEGLGVILISGEPEEIITSCDRVLVLGQGKVVGEFTAPVEVDEAVSRMHKES